MVLWQTLSDAIILNNSMPAVWLVKVVRRNQNDSEKENLHQNETTEPREAPGIVLKRASWIRRNSSQLSDSIRGNSSQNVSQDGETFRKLVRLVPRVDQRFHGVPQADVQNDEARKQLVSNLTRLILINLETKKLIDELFINIDDAYKPMSAIAKETLKNH